MQYDVATPEEYLEQLEADWRKDKLLQVRAYILEAAPEWKEIIRYKMLAYDLGVKAIFGLNAQKHYVSLYVGTIEKIPDSHELLKGFNYGKGCIRISKSILLEKTHLKTFIEKKIALWRLGEETDC